MRFVVCLHFTRRLRLRFFVSPIVLVCPQTNFRNERKLTNDLIIAWIGMENVGNALINWWKLRYGFNVWCDAVKRCGHMIKIGKSFSRCCFESITMGCHSFRWWSVVVIRKLPLHCFQWWCTNETTRSSARTHSNSFKNDSIQLRGIFRHVLFWLDSVAPFRTENEKIRLLPINTGKMHENPIKC